MDNQQQLAFDFDKEIPSPVEPLQQKEKELGVSSPDLIPRKIQLINFYVENGKYNNAHKWLTKVIEQIHFTQSLSKSGPSQPTSRHPLIPGRPRNPPPHTGPCPPP